VNPPVRVHRNQSVIPGVKVLVYYINTLTPALQQTSCIPIFHEVSEVSVLYIHPTHPTLRHAVSRCAGVLYICTAAHLAHTHFRESWVLFVARAKWATNEDRVKKFPLQWNGKLFNWMCTRLGFK
jgi:hypothetical protein